MKEREQILERVKKILVGPNPLDEFKQENGEEILFGDSPLRTYVTGILFPLEKYVEDASEEANDDLEEHEEVIMKKEIPLEDKLIGDINIAEPVIENETSKINNYKQSAMGLTLCVSNISTELKVLINVGAYKKKQSIFPYESKDVEGKRIIAFTQHKKDCFFREQINSVLVINKENLPTKECRHLQYPLFDKNGAIIKGLIITATFRMLNSDKNYTIYTVTLLNSNEGTSKMPDSELCWFQCEFSVETREPLPPLPSSFYTGTKNEDYQLNSLLYREIETYAIGHGCSATWDDSNKPNSVRASSVPEYEVKPIMPASVSAKLSMETYASDRDETINDLNDLCNEYEEWIANEKCKIEHILHPVHVTTAKKQIDLCEICLSRMRDGLELLKTNEASFKAFQLANKAMLMQQLHFKMPLTEFIKFDTKTMDYQLKDKIVIPKINDKSTWYNPNTNKYGKWRAFQIAFILLNVNSIYDKNSPERNIVDLIWFPTGGGKTEAYLGLTAYTIFLRRLKKPSDDGTAVIMRYTLRLLTAQQYERASSLICAIEKIRSEMPDLLGKKRITIGLWVGGSLTENKSSEVIKKIKEIHSGKISENVSVVLKCPWCGASMETMRIDKVTRTPGYEISVDKKHINFRCGNKDCDFGLEDFDLPLNLFDDEIYENPPTLLFGTVDKFAMLPYRPEAKSLFGGDKQRTPPELIIQDELHLITGPVGSSVGLYETLINELCIQNGARPKIIASTATISGAKEQCNALYGCGEDRVFQFPVQGTSYKDNFFSREDEDAVGRKYVGLYGSAASSSATASIYTFAAFLYAAKSIDVDKEEDRDPYWTNLAYFGSMRELGQAATWYIADIKEYLEVIYRNRLESSLGPEKRRYIYESGLAELTSRMGSAEIPKILKSLDIKYGHSSKRPLDVCLATNMISVGVDISRLGLMTVTGQPKSMSEYIQSTSRVGRDSNAPGLVFVIYNTSKSRDKSHYEKFQSQHSKLYYRIEPTSVTPFSRPLRERALHAIFVALHRFSVEKKYRNDATRVPTNEEFDKIIEVIATRAQGIDRNEIDDIRKQLKVKLNEWRGWKPEDYSSFTLQNSAPLLVPAGLVKPSSWGEIGWETPTSMRNVERECGLDCLRTLVVDEGE